MSSPYTIAIPEPLYERAQRVARQTARHVDDVILDMLQGALDQPPVELPASERDELRAMAYLSDDTLWTIAREQLPATARERLDMLMARNSAGPLDDAEQKEFAALVERGDRLTLRKAQAMKYLTERGYRIRLTDLQADNA